MCNPFVYTEPVNRNKNGTDVVGVGTVVDCVVCVTNDIGTLVIIDDDGVCVASDIV